MNESPGQDDQRRRGFSAVARFCFFGAMTAAHLNSLSTTEAMLGRKIQLLLGYYRLCEPWFHQGSQLSARGFASNGVAISLIPLGSIN